ncbi:BON domain-containing protein [Flavobacterium sp.]|jgi:osmotically-inducible protein OsmY|uniref:BON domain-containing protein n=1 Tax=Flavobacterium sp. TaxID=239 RepID=UPI00260C975E|nr:BON domain-containing protein [Flavobacterium sp.]
MNANDQLQQNIQFALFWEPFIENISIGVTAQNGIVTLSGFVDSYEKKVEIEKIVKKVRGVKALVEHLEVQHGIVAESDEDLAIKALAAIKMNTSIPEEDIKIVVAKGWIYLIGAVDWNYQKMAAEHAVGSIIGVKGVVNSLLIHSTTTDTIEQKAIQNALKRSGLLRNKSIEVAVDDNVVTLTGQVDSILQKEEAERITWNSPGIWRIKNQIDIINH